MEITARLEEDSRNMNNDIDKHTWQSTCTQSQAQPYNPTHLSNHSNRMEPSS